MNVSMQDAFNLAWKLVAVLKGRAKPDLLRTYQIERHAIAERLIAFDKEWSGIMASPPKDPARPELGGQNLAPRPMEAVLAGAGGCTAYDVVLILQRGRHDVRGCTVRLTSERAAQDPKVFTRIDMHFTVTGKGIPAAAVERAIALSHEKYCSASIMLGKTAEITTSFALIGAA